MADGESPTFPPDFEPTVRPLLGADDWQRLALALDEEPPVSIRLNPLKGGFEPVAASGRVAWCPTGCYLPQRPAFTFDPLLHAGVYYVQEASSMFLDTVLRQHVQRPVAMLDLCAAPGGKSTVCRAVLPEGSLLVSNEPVRQRANVLCENMLKFGHPDVVVTNNLPADFRRAGLQFDAILTDVPCSGEGMFRKDHAARGEWSLAHVEKCRLLQRDIVAEAWQCLRPGGLLVYSTCTLNTRENEENVLWMCRELGAVVQGVDIQADWGIRGALLSGFNAPAYRFLPGFVCGEGLFVAVVRKPGSGGQASVPALRQQLHKRLRVLSDGVRPPMQKGRDRVPDVSEALSVRLVDSAYPRCELSYPQAIAYLRKEAIVLPPDAPRGIVLLTFQGAALGFAKNVGNRANNLYPQEWKIRSTHIPTDYEAILRHS